MKADLLLEKCARRIEGPLLFLERTVSVGLNHAVEVISPDGKTRIGRVAALDEHIIVVEVLASTSGLGLAGTVVRLHDAPLCMPVGPGLMGRIFDSVGRPLDGGPSIVAEQHRPVDGRALNPVARALPRDFIETSITSIDLLNSLVRGQKLPIFSGGGLPHDRLATEIAQRARLREGVRGDFCVVFVGIGVSHDSAEAFRQAMADSGALEHTVMFLNRADEPSAQRLLTPRFALTAAEYLAFEQNQHVLVVMTDMTNYCEALREVSASHGEIPGRKGYPGYMYSDLAGLFERAGCVSNRQGTITQIPILSMPGDDIGHPIPDLTGYITEGQIVLGRDLDRRGIYPPVQVLPSLSRLMDAGIGSGFTHADHPGLANQLFASYARAIRVRVLESVMGEEGLSSRDKAYLAFAETFETDLVNQSEGRTLEQSMELGWQILACLPHSELTRLSTRQIQQYLGKSEDD